MPYTTFTRAAVRALLQDRWEGTPFWTATEANDSINEALLWWNLLTGFWKTSATVPTVANHHEVDLPDSLVFGARVTYLGAPVAPTSIRGISLTRSSWEGELITSGGGVPTSIKRWWPLGLTRIGIWPATAAPVNIVVHGVAATPLLTADGQFLDLGEEELAPLLGEALHICSFKVGGAVLQSTLPLHKAFLVAAGDRNSLLKASQFFRKLLSARDPQRWMHPVRAPGDGSAVAQGGGGG